MKKYIVKTDYNSGLMFDSKENALGALEAIPVKQDFNNGNWSISDNDKEISLFIIDDSKISSISKDN